MFRGRRLWAGRKASGAHPAVHALVITAVHLVAEDDLQEGGVVQLLPAGQGDALGQGRSHVAQLEPLQQG